jgi:hypothetical protein
MSGRWWGMSKYICKCGADLTKGKLVKRTYIAKEAGHFNEDGDFIPIGYVYQHGINYECAVCGRAIK